MYYIREREENNITAERENKEKSEGKHYAIAKIKKNKSNSPRGYRKRSRV